MAGHGEDVGVWRRVRWKVAGFSGSRGPKVVPRGKRKKVNRSDLFWLRLFCKIWDGMGGITPIPGPAPLPLLSGGITSGGLQEGL